MKSIFKSLITTLTTSNKKTDDSRPLVKETLEIPHHLKNYVEPDFTVFKIQVPIEDYKDSAVFEPIEKIKTQQTVVSAIKPPEIVNKSKEVKYSDSETIQEHRRNLYMLFHRNFGKDWMVFITLFYWPKKQQYCLSYIRSLPEWMKDDESWMKKRSTYYALARKIMDCYFEAGFDNTLELIKSNKYRFWWSDVQGMRKQPIISSELYKQLNPKKVKSAEVIEDFEIISAEEWEKERKEQKIDKENNNACKEKNPTVLTQADLLKRLHSTANRYQELFHKYMDKKLKEYEFKEFLELERKRAIWQRKCEEYDEEQEALFLETKK